MNEVYCVSGSRYFIAEYLEWKTNWVCTVSEEGGGRCAEMYEYVEVL